MLNPVQTFKLLLPVLVPSWGFFDFIAPSPRIEYAHLKTAQDTPAQWQELNPKPAHTPLIKMLQHLFWNIQGNDNLFLVSCAERLLEQPCPFREAQIFKRIQTIENTAKTPYTQFRIITIHRDGENLVRAEHYRSAIHKNSENKTP